MTEARQGSAAAPSAHGAGGPSPRDLLLCLSHLRWDFVFQRPQHLLTRAAQQRDVVFLEEAVFLREAAAPRLDLRRVAAGITVAVPHLPPGLDEIATAAAQRTLLDDLLAQSGMGDRRLIAWFYTPMALSFAAELAADLVVYDCMDELSLFRGAPPRMVELERRLLARADLVFTGGRSLYEAKRQRHRRVHCFPSSIDPAHFRAARERSQPEPTEMAGLRHPRIGFFGVVDERMDLGLIAALAQARPAWSFVMVGPVVKIDPATLPQLRNLHWVGARRYEELPAWLGSWDAGFMPFARNESTRFISPTKTPEFLAAGLPVVSTPITDVVRDWGPEGADLVTIAADPEDMVRAIERMLVKENPAAWLARVDAVLSRQSWDLTWRSMEQLIDAALAGPAEAAAAIPVLLRSAP